MRLAIISLRGKSSRKIALEAKKYFEIVDELNLKDFEVHLNDSGIEVEHLKKDLEKYDCIYVRGSFRYSLLQKSITRALPDDVYVPIKSKAFTLGHDKFLTAIELQKNQVHIPKTYYAANKKIAEKILEEIEYPVIIKLSEGTQGKGVMIAESKKSAKTILDLLEKSKSHYLLQEFVETEKTSDIRVIIAGKKVIASYKRVATDGEIRANTHLGGTREQNILTKEQEELAINSALAIGADVCGVDILNNNHPSVIEVNLSPGISEIDEVTGKNVAKEIAKALYFSTKKFKKRLKEKIKKKLRKQSLN